MKLAQQFNVIKLKYLINDTIDQSQVFQMFYYAC